MIRAVNDGWKAIKALLGHAKKSSKSSMDLNTARAHLRMIGYEHIGDEPITYMHPKTRSQLIFFENKWLYTAFSLHKHETEDLVDFLNGLKNS